jgi:hypothetical protein
MTNKCQVQEVSDTIPFQKTVCPELSAGVLLVTSRLLSERHCTGTTTSPVSHTTLALPHRPSLTLHWHYHIVRLSHYIGTITSSVSHTTLALPHRPSLTLHWHYHIARLSHYIGTTTSPLSQQLFTSRRTIKRQPTYLQASSHHRTKHPSAIRL